MRNIGKKNNMILSILDKIKAGEEVGILGCNNPQDITERLQAHGVTAKNKPILSEPRLKAVYDSNSIEGEIIGFQISETNRIGYTFYK